MHIRRADGSRSYATASGGVIGTNLIRLTLFDAVAAGESVTIDYTPGSVSDASGSPLSPFSAPLSNLSGTTAVTFSSGTVHANVVELRFAGTVTCAVSCETGMFIQRADGSRSYATASGGVVGPDLIRLTLFDAVPAGEGVVIHYRPGSLSDGSGNPLVEFSALLTNLSVTSTAGLTSATVRGNIVDLRFSASVRCTVSCETGMHLRRVDGSRSYATASGAAIGDDMIRLTLFEAVPIGEAVMLDYTPGSVTDVNGDPLVSFSASLTNLSGISVVGLTSATVRGNIVDLRFSAPVQCAVSCETGMHIRRIDGSRSHATASAGLMGTGLIQLMLFDAVPAGDAVMIEYVPGSVIDAEGNALTPFNAPLTNLAETAAVSLLSATVHGNVVELRFTGTIRCAVSCETGMVLRRADGSRSYRTASGGVVGTDLIRLTLFDAVPANEDVGLHYTPGSVADESGNPVAGFSALVTNLLVAASTDITGVLRIVKGTPILNPLSREWIQIVLVRNPSTEVFSGPLSYVMDDLPFEISVSNKSGTTKCTSPGGAPYVQVHLGSDETLGPGEVRLLAVSFVKSSWRDRIKYSHRILAGSGCR